MNGSDKAALIGFALFFGTIVVGIVCITIGYVLTYDACGANL